MSKSVSGFDFTTNLTCHNCFARTYYTLSRLVFKTDGGTITNFGFYASGDASFNMELDLRLDIEGARTLRRHLATYPLFGITIPIPGYPVELGLFVDLYARADFQASLSVNANVGMAVGVLYKSKITYPPSYALEQSIEYTNWRYTPPAIEATASVTAALGIEPVLRFSVATILVLKCQFFPHLLFTGMFHYPPVSEASAPAYANVGDCALPHLLRFSVQAGFKDCNASYELNLNFGSGDFGSKSGSWSLMQPRYLPKPILAGCLLNPSADTVVRVNISLLRTIKGAFMTSAELQEALREEWAAVVEVSVGRLFIVAVQDDTVNGQERLSVNFVIYNFGQGKSSSEVVSAIRIAVKSPTSRYHEVMWKADGVHSSGLTVQTQGRLGAYATYDASIQEDNPPPLVSPSPTQQIQPGNEEPLFVVDAVILGGALGGVFGGVTAAGAVLLIVRYRKKRRRGYDRQRLQEEDDEEGEEEGEVEEGDDEGRQEGGSKVEEDMGENGETLDQAEIPVEPLKEHEAIELDVVERRRESMRSVSPETEETVPSQVPASSAVYIPDVAEVVVE